MTNSVVIGQKRAPSQAIETLLNQYVTDEVAVHKKKYEKIKKDFIYLNTRYAVIEQEKNAAEGKLDQQEFAYAKLKDLKEKERKGYQSEINTLLKIKQTLTADQEK